MSDELSNSIVHPRTGTARARGAYESFAIGLKNGAFAIANKDMPAPSSWEFQQDCHTLIVHLHGRMRRLETHIEGAGSYRGPVRPGDIWLIPAQRHYRGQVAEAAISYAELKFDGAALAVLAGNGDASLQPRMRHRDPLVHALIARLAALSTRQDDLSCMLRESLAASLALHLLHSQGNATSSHDERSSALAPAKRRRLEDHILSHLDQRLTLRELARVAELGEHQLIPAFRRSFGATPMQFVIAQRLELARALLTSTRQDITSIALASGFSSHSHLSTTFRQHHGLTPRQYRAQAKGY